MTDTYKHGTQVNPQAERELRHWAFQNREEEIRELEAIEIEEREKPVKITHDPEPCDWKREREEDRERDWEEEK